VQEVLEDRCFTIFDGSIRIHLDDIEITGSDIRFWSTGYQERVFYAACATGWNCESLNPVDEADVEAKLFHLPPIKYRNLEERWAYHLEVDMFQNGWVERNLRIPVVRLASVLRTWQQRRLVMVVYYLHGISC